MTDNEIIRGLEHCKNEGDCFSCPLHRTGYCVNSTTVAESYCDLINRQKAEIERLDIELQAMRGAANSYKAETERLQKELRSAKHYLDSIAEDWEE